MPRGKQLPDDVIEHLGGLVRERCFIYDAKEGTHMDVQKMSNAWESIAKTLKVEGLNGKAWRVRWKNLRHSYMKQQRLLEGKKSGDTAKKANKWKFFDILSFLEPYIATNEVDTNSQTLKKRTTMIHREFMKISESDSSDVHAGEFFGDVHGIDTPKPRSSKSATRGRCSPTSSKKLKKDAAYNSLIETERENMLIKRQNLLLKQEKLKLQIKLLKRQLHDENPARLVQTEEGSVLFQL